MMDDGLDYQPAKDEVWPPAPTLLLPERVHRKLFVTYYPLSILMLVCIGWGLIGLGVEYLRQWITHQVHVIHWDGVITTGSIVFGSQLIVQFWHRSEILKRNDEQTIAMRDAME